MLLTTLPNEVLQHVCQYLGVSDTVNFGLACRQTRTFCLSQLSMGYRLISKNVCFCFLLKLVSNWLPLGGWLLLEKAWSPATWFFDTPRDLRFTQLRAPDIRDMLRNLRNSNLTHYRSLSFYKCILDEKTLIMIQKNFQIVKNIKFKNCGFLATFTAIMGCSMARNFM